MPKEPKHTPLPSKEGKKLNKLDSFKPISDEDKQLFARAMQGVTKIQSDQMSKPQTRTTMTATPSQVNKKSTIVIVDKPFAFSDHNLHESIHSDQLMSFGQHRLQARQWQRLKTGKIPIDATLDLHGLSSREARETLAQFLFDSLKQQKRCLCIIHGRAKTQANPYPILKNHVYNWLQQHPELLAFHSCPRQLGGTGAVLVLLKRQRNS